MRIIERGTEHRRTFEFLKEVHSAIKGGDDMPRVLYTAMHYRLSGSTLAAAQQEGIIRRYGWRWEWTGGRLTLEMADSVAAKAKETRRIYAANIKRFKKK